MKVALTILALYALVVIVTKVYGYIRRKNMLRLQAKTVAIRVNGEPLAEDEIESFDKSNHLGAKIEYDVAYMHPLSTEQVAYTVTEIMFSKENAYVERTTIPTSGEFEILADPKNPHKIDVGVEFKVKGLNSHFKKKNDEMLKKFKK